MKLVCANVSVCRCCRHHTGGLHLFFFPIGRCSHASYIYVLRGGVALHVTTEMMSDAFVSYYKRTREKSLRTIFYF